MEKTGQTSHYNNARRLSRSAAGAADRPAAVRLHALSIDDTAPWGDLSGVAVPFEAHLSLVPLIEWWRKDESRGAEKKIPDWLDQALRTSPELAGPIEEVAALAPHRDVVRRLLSCAIPLGGHKNMLSAALVPLQTQVVYATPAFERVLEREGQVNARLYRDAALFSAQHALSVYGHIARSLYGFEIQAPSAFVVSSKDPDTGLDRYFSISYDQTFLNVRMRGEHVGLPREERTRLANNPADLQLWMELLPPENFVLEGVELLHAADVTEHQVLSMLKTDLLEADTIGSGTLYPVVVERLRTFLGRPRVSFGLAHANGDQLTPVYNRTQGAADPLFRSDLERDLAMFDGSIFTRSIDEQSILVVDDLSLEQDPAAIEQDLLKNGVRSVASVPLFERGKLFGLLYIWSNEPDELVGLEEARLHAIVPLFLAVVQRFRDELRSRIQDVILSKYTAIHQSVEWKFRKAAFNYVRRQDLGRRPEVEPIIFDEVYPMYAAADIRGSSTHRNEAVQYDLLDQLGEVESILDQARRIKPLPIIEYLQARTSQYRTSLYDGLTSDDEVTVKDFLQRNIDPLLEHVHTMDPDLASRVDAYMADRDHRTGRLFQRCRSFEQSVELVNRAISSYLDAEEAKAQAMFPHYFEKHETDGVEFSMYVGASLVEDGTFDPIYVRNLRLWQLMIMCGIARRVHQVRAHLEVPLEVTQLILSQNTPISIRFQMDEMRFDVDGTYDIRYEIMKRRIDKALLKGVNERLTQPDKVAIVYSQAREAWEYEEYIRFLQLQGLISGDAEEVELADLQGIKGLKALRVSVNVENDEDVAPEVLERAMESLTRDIN